MKRTILSNIVLCMMMSLTMLVSCTKDDENENPVPIKEEANYYVKYYVFATSGFSGAYLPLEITCTTGLPTNTYTTKNSWEETFGPFKKGEIIRLVVKGNSELTGRIYVSKNQEPFSLKVEKNGYLSISLEHQI